MKYIKISVPDDFDDTTKRILIEYPGGETDRADFKNLEVEVWQPQYRNILDHGFIGLIDFMGNDATVVNAARTSYGTGTRRVSEDRNLIRYLIRNRHWSPIEMVEILWHVKAPIIVFRQWHRHRMASLNEYSARYSVLSDEIYVPDVDVMKPQSTTNKKGGAGEPSERDIQACLLQIEHAYKEAIQS